LRGKRRGPHPVVRGPGSRGAIGEGGRAFRRPPSDARVPREPDPGALVGYIVASGPVAYSAILRKNFADSSSKLSFHLQKLQSDGLLAKGDAGRYGVTEAGQRAWQVVRALAERTSPSLLILKS